METIDKIIRLFSLYIAAVVGAFALSVCFWALSFLACLFYVPTLLCLVWLIGIPLGSTLGIYIQDKRKYELPTYLPWRISSAFLVSLFGVMMVLKVLPLYGIDITDWLPPVFGKKIAIEFDLLNGSFFSLIGYLLISLFGGRKGPELQTSAVFFRRILPLGILVILVSVAVYLSVTWQKEKIDSVKETERSIRFLGQFLSSINEETDFYKNHSTETVLQEIQTYRSKISKNYDRRDNYDTTKKGWYECHIIFDEKQLFLAGIDTSQSDCVMGDFKYLGTTRKQTQSEPLRTGEATEFFRQILSSINNGTDSYKNCSESSAIQEIEAYRSMISSNYVLFNRETKGWDDFDFYVQFDGKNKFRLNIDGSKGGFVLRSFTYIGKK